MVSDLAQCFSMAAFLGFIELNSYMINHESVSPQDAAERIKRVRAKASGFDFQSAIVLSQHLEADLPWTPSQDGLRLFITEWTKLVNPTWLRHVPYGRRFLKQALRPNELQCFREAGLFDDPPNDAAVSFWDRMSALVRNMSDEEKMMRARTAERMSMDYESRRLRDLGIPSEPKWVALEDNSLGYDILSYDLIDSRTIPKMIEVKSSLSHSIIITRNEWENAQSAPNQSVFHVWLLRSTKKELVTCRNTAPLELSVDHMRRHIPHDCGEGKWLDVEVNVTNADFGQNSRVDINYTDK